MNIVIIGGDERQIILADELKTNGYNVTHIIEINKIDSLNSGVDVVILPIPVTRDNITVYCTLSEDKIPLFEIKNRISNQPVIGGGKNFGINNYINILENDDFAILNGVPTAEGAIAIAINTFPFTIWQSKCLITGYGRIGKILAERLLSLKADVTITARKQADVAIAVSNNIKCISPSQIAENISDYNIIYNTVPKQILTVNELKNIKNNTAIIELASAPGGVDIEAAKKLGIKIINAPSLPSKTAPATAGKVLYKSIAPLIEDIKRRII